MSDKQNIQIVGDIEGSIVMDVNLNNTKDKNEEQINDKTGNTAKIRKWVKLNGFPMWMFIVVGILSFISFGYSLFTLLVGYPIQIDLDKVTYDATSTTTTILSILVTFLSAWQIYSTIKAREELRETQKELKEKFETRINKLETDLNKLLNQQSKNEGIEETKAHISEAINLAFPPRLLERVNLEIARKGTKLYGWLWSIIDEAKTNGQILENYADIKEKRPNDVSYINGREATEAEVIELADEIRPLKIMVLNTIK